MSSGVWPCVLAGRRSDLQPNLAGLPVSRIVSTMALFGIFAFRFFKTIFFFVTQGVCFEHLKFIFFQVDITGSDRIVVNQPALHFFEQRDSLPGQREITVLYSTQYCKMLCFSRRTCSMTYYRISFGRLLSTNAQSGHRCADFYIQ